MALRRAPVYTLVAITFLQWVGFSSTYIAVPMMVLQEKCAVLGLSGDDCQKSNLAQSEEASFMTLWLFVTQITAVLFCTLISHLSDIVGRRPLIIASAIRSIMVYAILSQEGCTTLSMVIFSMLNCFGDTFTSNGVVFACGTDSTVGGTEIDRALVLGRLESALWAGQVVGPLISGHLCHMIGPQNAFYFPLALSVVNLMITLTLPETLSDDRRVPFSFQKAHPLAVIPILYRHPRSMIYSAGMLWILWGLFSGVTTWPMFCTHFLGMSSGGIGELMAVFFAANATGLFLLIPIFTRSLSPRFIILLACAFSILMWGAHFALQDVWQLFAMTFLGIFSNLFFPMVRAGIATDLGPKMYGGASGVISLVQDIVMVGQGPAANTIWKYIQLSNLPDTVAYAITAFYCSVAFLIFWFLPSDHGESKTQKELGEALHPSQGSAKV